MARSHVDHDPDMKLPREHLSVFTWITVVTIVVMIALFVAWGLWLAGPTVVR